MGWVLVVPHVKATNERLAKDGTKADRGLAKADKGLTKADKGLTQPDNSLT